MAGAGAVSPSLRCHCAFPALPMRFPCAFSALSLRFPCVFLRYPCAYPPPLAIAALGAGFWPVLVLRGAFFTSLSEFYPPHLPFNFTSVGTAGLFETIRRQWRRWLFLCGVLDVTHFLAEVDWALSRYLNYDPKD